MQVLNHGSRCPTNGVASARYTRASTDEGPGVSINRYGGLSSPTCCVMVFVLLYSENGMRKPPRLRSSGEHSVTQREIQFSRNAPPTATDKLAATGQP